MSIKSLLQLILFFLIVLILGGIYFLYFYSGPNKKLLISNNSIENIKSNSFNSENVNDQEILGDKIINENQNSNINLESINSDGKTESSFETKNKINKNSKDLNKETEQIKNLTKAIEYITTNENGDTFKILAKYGKTSLKNNNILNLVDVNGTVSSVNRSDILISSDNANYNYTNQNSKFYNNVKINYETKEITCNNFDVDISENIAVAYNNVIVKDGKSIMKAQVITLDIITKNITINSDDKIKIIKNNGTN
tara:strand:+ start:81 stop:842 length:762 start_codon:yes stop_codon:yes gene_type:complete